MRLDLGHIQRVFLEDRSTMRLFDLARHINPIDVVNYP